MDMFPQTDKTQNSSRYVSENGQAKMTYFLSSRATLTTLYVQQSGNVPSAVGGKSASYMSRQILSLGLRHCKALAVKAMTGRGDNDTSVQP